jgi:S-adenosylmethionine:tRNA ribosyltransferase-isomerase
LVFNESKVIPARILGHKESGGKVEIFLVDLCGDNGIYRALIKQRGKKIGQKIICNNFEAVIVEKYENCYGVAFSKSINEVMKSGTMPIPPYFRRIGDKEDESFYQTIYAKTPGSVAAPTAGLHFDEELLSDLKEVGIEMAYITLHVGPGTFNSVRDNDITTHIMHHENFLITPGNYQKITNSKRIIPVGTTSLRALESALKIKDFVPGNYYSTNLFIYPGYEFVSSVAGIITNFHLPKSTLLMLAATLMGREKILQIYKTAMENNYRFLSYGDAMLWLH